MNIALVAETAPAKTLIPIIEKLDDDEIISLTHDTGAMELLSPYSVDIKAIGESRKNTSVKRSNFTIGRLVLQDTYKTYKALKNSDTDLVITCGNSGDVRKGILAAKKLDIPVLHMEQDIYNPIEMIAYANLITVPNNVAQKNLKKMYEIGFCLVRLCGIITSDIKSATSGFCRALHGLRSTAGLRTF